MFMPMHAGKCRTKYLHPVHTYIPAIGIGIFGMNNGKRNERPAIFGPAGYYRQFM